ncbi:molecular chaperone [Pseudomonas sp. NPDC007930]|uniref:molecular chaperone n=1 Tax=Pseudomonas sp. NPDC007930 TaxID=3364417 RepID=UPI0036E64C90
MKCLAALRHWAVAVLCWAPLSAQAGPDLNLGALYSYLPAERSSLAQQVENFGEHTAFVQLELAEMAFGADGQLAELPLPAQGLQRALLGTPAQFIIPAKGFHSVRLIFRGARDRERYFRVRYVPVLPGAGSGFTLAEDEVARYQEALGAGVQVLKGIGAVLIVRPRETHYLTQIEPSAQGLTLRNAGNATVLLDNLRQCGDPAQPCALGQKLHLRPGQAHTLLPGNGQHYRFNLVEGEKVRGMRYPEEGA